MKNSTKFYIAVVVLILSAIAPQSSLNMFTVLGSFFYLIYLSIKILLGKVTGKKETRNAEIKIEQTPLRTEPNLIYRIESTPLVKVENEYTPDKAEISFPGTSPSVQTAIPSVSSRRVIKENDEEDNVARCPKCKSTSIVANQKGYSFTKSAVTTAAMTPLAGLFSPVILVGGLLGGFAGRKKIKVTCLKCGKKWSL